MNRPIHRLRTSGIALAAALCLPAFSYLEAAKLAWDRTEARLEMEPDQEQIRASFTVTNESDETLRIARVKTSCGCTGSIVDRKIMKPGESAEIVGTFNKGKRQGKNHNKLEVFLDNQPESVATLHMIVDIPTLVEVKPAIVYWSASSRQSPRSARIDLDERYVDRIETLRYDESVLQVTKEKDPSGKADLILKVEPKSYDKTARETIEILAAGPDGRKAEGKVMVFVQP
ncbi:MAG: DUF1573 domain-containing protein [Verrucomicrobiota bacterium]